MCGIAGVIGVEERIGCIEIKAMLESLRHRGPDETGMAILPLNVNSSANNKAVFGHARLSIIDIAGGKQPILSEDTGVLLLCNGEIYNFSRLTAKLKARGHIFKTASDSEVILHLYEENPETFVRELDGMFAFAIYDLNENRLILGRDRFGKKPLFYKLDGSKITFSSELCAIRNPGELNLQMLHHFLSFQCVPQNASIYSKVNAVPPGSTVTFDLPGGKISENCYYRPDFSTKLDIPLHEAAAEVGRLLTCAVQKRLISEVPLGGFLSGGLDSAAVAALLTEHAPHPVCLSSIGFADKQYDESAAIRRNADFIAGKYPGKSYHKLSICEFNDFDELCEVAGFFGQPFADASMLPTAQLCRSTRRSGLTVALSGDGADEIFGGYERYIALALSRRAGFLASVANLRIDFGRSSRERSVVSRIRRLSGMLKLPEDLRYFSLVAKADNEQKLKLYGEKMLAATLCSSEDFMCKFASTLTAINPVERCAELDIATYLPNDILTKVDICSMHYGLEVRSPFLDADLANFAFKLPWGYKQHYFSRKRILRRALTQMLPSEILMRKKRGFGIPVDTLLRTVWRSRAGDFLTIKPLAVEMGLLNRGELKKLWDEHQSKRKNHAYTLFNLLILEIFLRKQL